MEKTPRIYDEKYLAWLRTQPCCVCGKSPCDAAHIRSGNLGYGKRETGLAEKPSDQWALPLDRECHCRQHSMNELGFYAVYGIDPFALAIEYYSRFGGTGGKARAQKAVKPRLPREKRKKMQSRSFGAR